MIKFPTDEAEALRQSEESHALVFAWAFGVFTVFLSAGAALFGWALALPFTGYMAALVFLAGGISIGVILLTGLRRGRRAVSEVIGAAEKWLNTEIKLKTAALSAPSAPALPLPAPEREVVVSRGNRVEQIPLELVHGFDPRDLRFLCRLLANGFKFTEAAMERLTLPYSGESMGKADGNTNYARFMAACVAGGVISGRTARQSGQLVVTDPDEMYRRIKLAVIRDLTGY